MAQFPRTDAEIKVLAQNIAAGLTANAATYPAPPVTAVALQAVLDSLITLTDEAVAAQAAAEQATATKRAGLEELTDAMKAILRYAEDTVDYNDALLTLLDVTEQRFIANRPENVTCSNHLNRSARAMHFIPRAPSMSRRTLLRGRLL